MKTKTIKQMETQFNRVARRFWRIESTAELTDEWTNRLAKMAAALSRYRKNAYEYIWAKREAGHWIGDKEEGYPVPSSIYAKQPEVQPLKRKAMKESNFDRLYRHTPANRLSDDERGYTSWMLRNSPDSPCYDRHGIKDANFFCGCALVNIICGKDIWGTLYNL